MRGERGWLGQKRLEEEPKKIIVVGVGNIADVAYEFLKSDSPYEMVAFSVEEAHMASETKFGLPIVPFETLEKKFSPAEYGLFIAVGYGRLNHLRGRFYRQAKSKGYRLVSYISSQAFVWKNVEIGENCFILEDNVIQPFVKIGNNVMLWSGNHIGHGTVIRDHVYLASHVVVSGFVEIGEYSFVGVNATFADSVKVGRNCLIGAGALILKDTEERRIYRARGSKPEEFSILSPAAREIFWPGEEK